MPSTAATSSIPAAAAARATANASRFSSAAPVACARWRPSVAERVTAIGQATLAWLDRDTQIRLLEARPREQRTATTLTALDALLLRLERVRAQGFALSDQENVSGVRVLAAPVRDADGVAIAALSVATPAPALSLAAFKAAARAPVIAAAASLSRALQAGGAYAPPRARSGAHG